MLDPLHRAALAAMFFANLRAYDHSFRGAQGADLQEGPDLLRVYLHPAASIRASPSPWRHGAGTVRCRIHDLLRRPRPRLHLGDGRSRAAVGVGVARRRWPLVPPLGSRVHRALSVQPHRKSWCHGGDLARRWRHCTCHDRHQPAHRETDHPYGIMTLRSSITLRARFKLLGLGELESCVFKS